MVGFVCLRGLYFEEGLLFGGHFVVVFDVFKHVVSLSYSWAIKNTLVSIYVMHINIIYTTFRGLL